MDALDWLAGRPGTRSLRSACSAPAPGPPGRSARRPTGPTWSAPSSPAAAAPTWRREALPRVQAPVLLIVGGRDEVVLDAQPRTRPTALSAPHELAVVPGASHLFEEPGALDQVADLAARWFRRHLPRPVAS